MHSQRPPSGHRKSAFAAAAFSFIFPGLGQAYLGLWTRALAWAALPILMIALVGGLVLNKPTRDTLEGFALQPDILLGILLLLVVDLVYRAACVVDAFRMAGRRGEGAVGPGILSAAGLVAVLAVLMVSHVAIARPVMVARDAIVDVTGGTVDEPDGSFGLDPDESFIAPFTQPPSAAPDPSATPAEPTPTPEPTPTRGPSWTEGGRLNVLLVGADAGRHGYGNYLTDTMIVVSIDPETRQTAFITMPRDTSMLPIPRDWPAYRAWGGLFGSKANTIYTYAARISPSQYPGPNKNRGFNALKGILGETLGLTIDYFVAVDLRSFRSIINDLGGVMIDVQGPVQDDAYPADDGDGHIKLYVAPGIQYMGGQEALAYARSRHTTSDFDRSARQQRVITSVRDQLDLPSLLAPGVLPDLIRTFRSSIKTDIPPDKIPALIQLVQDIDLDKRISLALDPPTYSSVCYPCPPSGLYVLQANVSRMRKDVANVFKRSRGDFDRAAELKGEGAVVHVLNGTSAANTRSTRISDYLASVGIDAVVPPVAGGAADRTDYTETVLRVYNGAQDEMPATIAFLEKTFKVTAEPVDDPAQEADIVVIVGSRTPALKP